MSLTIRKATLNDSDQLFAWRNDPDVIATSTTGRGVTEAEHDRWFIRVLSDKAWHLYVAQCAVGWDRPKVMIGMGRIVNDHGMAVLSYSIDKGYRGRGFGGELVKFLCDKAYELGFTSIQAVARHHNTASLRALLRNDFIIDQNELLTLKKRIR